MADAKCEDAAGAAAAIVSQALGLITDVQNSINTYDGFVSAWNINPASSRRIQEFGTLSYGPVTGYGTGIDNASAWAGDADTIDASVASLKI